MKILLLLVSLGAGALVGWLSIIGGIWFLMPLFLIGAGVVATALDWAVRWRILAFSVGLLCVFGLQANQFVQNVTATQRELKNHKLKIRPTATPAP